MNPDEFEGIAMQVFRLQASLNPVYKEYLQLIKQSPESISSIGDIPYLPISLFKTHRVSCSGSDPQAIFSSSGTTSSDRSKHYIDDLDWYEQVTKAAFEHTYGSISDWKFLALLPGYASESSLVHMVSHFVSLGREGGGFILEDPDRLQAELSHADEKTMLIGVSHAFMDLANMETKATIVETGGMKGRGQEVTRQELHSRIQQKLGVPKVHSEYGMTELMSQAWSQGDGVFSCPPWMRVRTRDIYDPFFETDKLVTGGIDIIDLANLDSCAFISTDDLGVIEEDGFRVLGRFDQSDQRGCNLLLTDVT
jgi:hypothetical protein